MIPKGFLYAGARCGLKNKRNDLGLLVSETPARAAGLFTTNLVHAACVDYTRSVISGGVLRAIVVNSGNANCCTGIQGQLDTAKMGELAANALGVPVGQVAVASTGVIGHPIDMAKVEIGVGKAAKVLGVDPVPFMHAILTTDLVEKQATASIGEALIYGVAKGSGMIAPNLATMLSFVTTDADVEGFDLDGILRRVAEKSFNNTLVDGDSSTNDMLIVLANGASGVRPSPEEFETALGEVCVSLAKQIAKDGEGATKLVEVQVTGSTDPRRAARTIAESPLVKTAMFGCDPNWGRILAAAGRSGVQFDVCDVRLALRMGDEEHLLFANNAPTDFDPKRVSTALKSDHVIIELFLGNGPSATVYTCDFGYGYVRINAEYHT